MSGFGKGPTSPYFGGASPGPLFQELWPSGDLKVSSFSDQDVTTSYRPTQVLSSGNSPCSLKPTSVTKSRRLALSTRFCVPSSPIGNLRNICRPSHWSILNTVSEPKFFNSLPYVSK